MQVLLVFSGLSLIDAAQPREAVWAQIEHSLQERGW
jgi:hypothetical protein